MDSQYRPQKSSISRLARIRHISYGYARWDMAQFNLVTLRRLVEIISNMTLALDGLNFLSSVNVDKALNRSVRVRTLSTFTEVSLIQSIHKTKTFSTLYLINLNVLKVSSSSDSETT